MSGVNGVNGVNGSQFPYDDEKLKSIQQEKNETSIWNFDDNQNQELDIDDFDFSDNNTDISTIKADEVKDLRELLPDYEKNWANADFPSIMPWNLFSGTGDYTINDWLWKQNYLFSSALVDPANPTDLETAVNYSATILKKKNERYTFKPSSLSEEEQRQARQDAIELLTQRLEDTEKSRPDYGDCEEYYNYGSIADWIFTHPLTLGLKEILGEDSEYTKFVYGTLAEDGMFTTINGGYYALDAIDNAIKSSYKNMLAIAENNPEEFEEMRSRYIASKQNSNQFEDASEIEIMLADENIPTEEIIKYMQNYIGYNSELGLTDAELGIREDHAYDFLRIRSVYNIDDDVKAKKELLEQLKANVDNPEEFSKLFYQITDGVNFSADEFHNYRTKLENGEEVEPTEVLLGRNYLIEDYARNKLGTSMAFGINKQVGTTLMKALVPGGSIWSFFINMGLDYLNESTKDNPDLSAGKMFEYGFTELSRSLPIKFGKSKIISFAGRMGIKGANKFLTERTVNAYDSFTGDASVRESLESGNYALGGIGYATGLASPSGQTEMIIDGWDTGSNLTSDISNSNAGVLIYDSQQLIANPVAQISYGTVGAWNSGERIMNGEANWSDYLQILSPITQFSMLVNMGSGSSNSYDYGTMQPTPTPSPSMAQERPATTAVPPEVTQSVQPTPTVTVTPTPTPTPTPTLTPTPTPTPPPSPTPAPPPSPTPEPPPSPTPEPPWF